LKKTIAPLQILQSWTPECSFFAHQVWITCPPVDGDATPADY
jgi:hypothetical protein